MTDEEFFQHIAELRLFTENIKDPTPEQIQAKMEDVQRDEAAARSMVYVDPGQRP